MRAEAVTGPVAYHGEGPVWSARWGGLRWVDMLAGDVLALGADGGVDRRHVGEVAAALRASPRLTVYPPVIERRERARRIVVKGDADLPAALADALADFRRPRPRGRGIIAVEVDPVEWPS